MATHSRILACRIPWTEEPGGLRSLGSQKGSDMTEHPHTCTYIHIYVCTYIYVSMKVLNIYISMKVLNRLNNNRAHTTHTHTYINTHNTICFQRKTTVNVKVKVAQLCLTLCVPMDYTVHGIFRPEYWSGQLFPSPSDLPNPRIESRSSSLQADSLPTELSGKPHEYSRDF